METTGSYGSKLNKIIERLNREYHTKTGIGIGLNLMLPIAFWYFSIEYVTFIKRRTWHTGINSTPYFKWTNQPFNYGMVRIFGSTGFRCIQESGKLVKKGSNSIFLQHGSSSTTIYSYGIEDKKWHRPPFFRFDSTCSSVPSHSLPLSFRNMLGKVKLEDITEALLNTSSSPFNPNSGFNITVQLTPSTTPLNITMKDDASYNLPVLHSLTKRHPWRKMIPTEYCRNSWILALK